MSADQFCDGCFFLDFTAPANQYDVYAAHCCDPEKPVLGRRRVIATAQTAAPFHIPSPVWCRGKKKEGTQ